MSDLYNFVITSTSQENENFKSDIVYWLFFDIEDKDKNSKECIPIDQIKRDITCFMEDICCRFAHGFKMIVVKCSVKDRYRIYTNVSMRLNQMKYIVESIESCKWYIDWSPYNVGCSLRLVNSPKYDILTKWMDTWTYAVSKDDFMHCVVHNTDGTLILPNSIALSYDEYYITPDNYASNH